MHIHQEALEELVNRWGIDSVGRQKRLPDESCFIRLFRSAKFLTVRRTKTVLHGSLRSDVADGRLDVPTLLCTPFDAEELDGVPTRSTARA